MTTKLSELMNAPIKDKEETSEYKVSQQESAKTPGEFISYLMNTRNILHVLHLRTKSFAAHMALDDLYKGIVDHIDSLVEIWQGFHQQIISGYSDFEFEDYENYSPVDFVKSCLEYVKSNRDVLGTESYIQNLLDELEEFLSQGLYKLTFLS